LWFWLWLWLVVNLAERWASRHAKQGGKALTQETCQPPPIARAAPRRAAPRVTRPPTPAAQGLAVRGRRRVWNVGDGSLKFIIMVRGPRGA
jgi:hypothetical protein